MRTSSVVVAAATLAACAPEPVIERAQVERVVSALAADSMLGRRAFTPSADRAARFISAEFAGIGLDTLEGLDGYLQPFSVYAFEPRTAVVVLNGRRVPGDRAIVSAAADSLHWINDDSVRVVMIGPAEAPMAAVGAAFQGGRDAIVLVHPAHREAFERMRGFLSGPRRSVQRVGRGHRVLVLTNETRARSFEVTATASVEEAPGANVVGVIPGRRLNELVLFSAHYDHVGTEASASGDSIFNGANDDASGTTAVIELARYFKAKRRPERTLVFAAFTAEEAGGFGARYFSQQLDPGRIVAMFNIEMIGKPSAQGANHAWITGFERSSLGTILQQAVAGTEYAFDPDPYPQENLFYRSDNATLAQLGVPAHSISTTPIDVDQDYHQVSDEVRTLDLDHMTNTIRAIARGAAPIIAASVTPTRVDTAQARRPPR
jgi:hypothetical protein